VADREEPNVFSAIPLKNFHVAFVIVSVIALVAILDVLHLAPTAGDNVRRSKTAVDNPTTCKTLSATKNAPPLPTVSGVR
jgi:hypothetical protein